MILELVHVEPQMCDKQSYLAVALALAAVGRANVIFSAVDIKGSRALVVRDPVDALNSVLQEIWPNDLVIGAHREVSPVFLDVLVAEEGLGAVLIAEELAFAEARFKGVRDVHGGRGQRGHDILRGAAELVAAQARTLPIIGHAFPTELVEVHFHDVIFVAHDASAAAHEQAVTDECLATVSPHGESAVRAPLHCGNWIIMAPFVLCCPK